MKTLVCHDTMTQNSNSTITATNMLTYEYPHSRMTGSIPVALSLYLSFCVGFSLFLTYSLYIYTGMLNFNKSDSIAFKVEGETLFYQILDLNFFSAFNHQEC